MNLKEENLIFTSSNKGGRIWYVPEVRQRTMKSDKVKIKMQLS